MKDKKAGLPMWAWIVLAVAVVFCPPLLAPIFAYMMARAVHTSGRLLGMSKRQAQWLLMDAVALSLLVGVTVFVGPLWWAEIGCVMCAALAGIIPGWRYVVGMWSLWRTPQGPYRVVDPLGVDDGWLVIKEGGEGIYARCASPAEAYRVQNRANALTYLGTDVPERVEDTEAVTSR